MQPPMQDFLEHPVLFLIFGFVVDTRTRQGATRCNIKQQTMVWNTKTGKQTELRVKEMGPPSNDDKVTTEDNLPSEDQSIRSDSDHDDSGSDDNSDYSSDDDGSDWDDESLIEIEERVNTFSGVGTTPALAEMVFNIAEFSVPGSMGRNRNREASSLSGRRSRSTLTPEEFEEPLSFALRKSESDHCIQSADYNNRKTVDEAGRNEDLGTPDACLKAIFLERGLEMKTFPAQTLDGFFVEMKEENFAAYGNKIATAVRLGDLSTVQEHYESGGTLQCCNKFQESILHTICRRGHLHLLKYIMTETNTSIKIRDDYGRTPLHDAAWTHEPNFELVKLLLQACPDLLFITDNRGFTPLAYVGRQLWADWCQFLQENRELLSPRDLA